MRNQPWPVFLIALAWILAGTTASTALSPTQDAERKASPFEAVRWIDDAPEVLVRSTWYRPIAIDGVAVADLLDHCEARWPGRRNKRFAEDLVEAMETMGHAAGQTVRLTLVRLEDGVPVVLADVAMSAANRATIVRAAQAAELARLGAEREPSSPATLTREAALADIAAFERRLDDQFAYRHWRGVDLPAALDAIRARLDGPIATATLADELHAVLCRFGDGHASASSDRSVRPTQYPPFLLDAAAGGTVAFRADRSQFLDPDRPWVMAVDDVPVDTWIESIRGAITDGSPQLVRHRALRDMRDLQRHRARLGRSASDTVRCRLAADPSGADAVDVELPMTTDRPIYGAWPRRDTGRLDGNIGYLRLPQMNDRLVPGLRDAMDTFRDTRGLIVDVRGNGGGSRGLLIALAGYLQAPDDSPWIGNVARYRFSDQFDANHLDARFMYRQDHSGWTPAQRQAIAAFVEGGFTPEWTPGPGFSERHFLVLGRTGHPDEYFYDRPVIILSDAACFSATDIFLGGLIGRPRVTVVGQPSGGGSARSVSFELPNSGIRVRCASMASFRPDGRLYDGRGVEVDVTVERAPTDLLVGGGDRALDVAMAMMAIK